MKRRWTRSEIEFLRKHYSNSSNKVLARKLRRNIGQVVNKAFWLELHKETYKKRSGNIEIEKRLNKIEQDFKNLTDNLEERLSVVEEWQKDKDDRN
jgi:hypothetical protein